MIGSDRKTWVSGVEFIETMNSIQAQRDYDKAFAENLSLLYDRKVEPYNNDVVIGQFARILGNRLPDPHDATHQILRFIYECDFGRDENSDYKDAIHLYQHLLGIYN